MPPEHAIRTGTVTAFLILKKLANYPRQNGLAKALREIGKIERALFGLSWYQDLDLRRRVNAGLNKGEARNALARAVFFNRLGELRDRSCEDQQVGASGPALLTAAIGLWNAVYRNVRSRSCGRGARRSPRSTWPTCPRSNGST
jgi:TnpA family transposase